MTDIVKGEHLTGRERKLLFWASFLALAAAGFGFAFRVAMGESFGTEFDLTKQQAGQVFGAGLWPIAITMIGFSLVVDRTGYKWPMFAAFVLQVASGIVAFTARDYTALYISALCAGLGHGIVEAVINPICAAVYPKAKTKWLTYLHASWPAGLVVGTLIIIATDTGQPDDWRMHALWIIAPAIAYAILYLPCRFPVDERVQAGVPYIDMLRQVGFLGAALASFMLIYEIGNQYFELTIWAKPDHWFTISLVAGVGVGAAFGLWVRSVGKPLFFLLCLLMIPIATAELGTDGWIKELMNPLLENAMYAIVFSAGIMMFFRVFAGGILKVFSPPTLLCLSGVFSAIGLFWLGGAAGAAVFFAFVAYAIGQTFYWPCMLGFVSERYPEGGALTLNTVSAIGLLSAGIVATPILGAAFDKSIHRTVSEDLPVLKEKAEEADSFMWMDHMSIKPEKAEAYINSLPEAQKVEKDKAYKQAKLSSAADVLKFAAIFPAILVVAFGCITIYFRSRGGYKPVELQKSGPD